jgi:hypothetical protein
MQRSLCYVLALALLLALCAIAGSATTVVPQSVEQLTDRSLLVVTGHSVRSWSAWDPSHRAIYTYTQFAVEQTLKGPAMQTVLVREMGGSVDGYAQKVAGVHPLSTGERAVLFLRPGIIDGTGALAVTGLMQGEFRITNTGEVSNGVMVRSHLESPPTEDINAYSGGAVRPYTGTKMTFEELQRRVGEAVRKEQAQ